MHRITEHLAKNHGVISRTEALRLGMTPHKIEYRLRSGRWCRIAPAVYQLAGSPLQWRGKVRATTLSVDGLASHGTAATLWRIDGWDQSRIEVVVANDRRPDPRPGVVIHRSTQMALADATTIDAVPVTGLARTVLDISASVGPKRLEWTVDAVLRTKELDWSDLYAVLSRGAARGRDGCGKLRAFLDSRFGDDVVPDSKFNRMVGQLLIDGGLHDFVYEYEIFRNNTFLARADIAFPRLQIAIECDSKKFHLHGHAFEADRKRQNRVTLAGWTVLQFTWQTFVESPAAIVNDVYNAVKNRHPKPNLEGSPR